MLPSMVFRMMRCGEGGEKWREMRMDVIVCRKYEIAERLEGEEYVGVFKDVVVGEHLPRTVLESIS